MCDWSLLIALNCHGNAGFQCELRAVGSETFLVAMFLLLQLFWKMDSACPEYCRSSSYFDDVRLKFWKQMVNIYTGDVMCFL
jgi:hypothetical protein